MAKKKETTAAAGAAADCNAKDLALKIYEIRRTVKVVQDEEKSLVKELKAVLNGETAVPGVCEFKTYENMKTDWETVAKALSSFVPKEKFEQIIANNSKPTEITKLLFDKDFKSVEAA